MFGIGLNVIIGLLILAISWKSTAFKRKTLLHIIVAILVVGLGLYNGADLYQKEDKIFNLNEQTDSLRSENKELITGQKIMIEQMDTLIFVIDTLTVRLEPFAEFALQKYPGKELDEALEMLKSDLESTKIRMDSLEANIKPRFISDEQHKSLMTDLIKITEISNVAIVYPSGNKEAENLAKQISTIFTESKIEHLFTWWTGDPISSGLWILSRSEESDIKANAISQAFIKAKITSKYARGSIIPEKNICIVVGSKP